MDDDSIDIGMAFCDDQVGPELQKAIFKSKKFSPKFKARIALMHYERIKDDPEMSFGLMM